MSALFIVMLSLVVPNEVPSEEIVRVNATVARLRAAPNKSAKSVERLPMGAELRVLKKAGSFFEVLTRDRKSGFVSRSLVQRGPLPTMLEYETRLSKKLGRKARRQLLERRVAQYPLSLEAIEGYQAFIAEGVSEAALAKARAKKTKFKSSDFGKGGAAKLYFLRKGWVAAKRKSLSPKGPLYPIINGFAILPLGCEEGAEANGARSPKAIPNLELRARATKIASSGKVVSVSEGGYKTQKLSQPSCIEGHLAYKMKKAKKGVLVPSWLVAGYKVTPFVQHRSGAYWAESPLARAEYREGQIVVGSMSVKMESRVPTSWIPVALLTLESGKADVIYRAPTENGCEGPTYYLDNYDFVSGERSQGKRYSIDRESVCSGSAFSVLAGEPRDIGIQNMLSEKWSR